MAVSTASLVLFACGGDGGGSGRACAADSAVPLSLPPLNAVTLDATDSCVRLEADGAAYLVVPQYASVATTTASFDYALGAPGTFASVASAPHVSGANPVQASFDASLRRAESELRPPAAGDVAAHLKVVPQFSVPALGTKRSFKVLSSLNVQNPTFADVTATLRYSGTNVLIYVDDDAPPPPFGFDDVALARLGDLMGTELYPVGVDRFGATSDLDGNGAVIVLMTPVVNKLTSAATCSSTGFVTGFFFGLDLSLTAQNSNRGEIYYSFVPDPGALFSCAHSQQRVERAAPATFIHELQHMISYNHHVLQRGGSAEVLWLNEGLSHIAEEFASRIYEERYPPPSGRTNPSQLFPDSSQDFISGNLSNGYRYLRSPATSTVTTMSGTGSLAERGATWLFLRWLGDQKGENIYRQLVQTNRRGIANVEAVAGEPFEALFGDFSMAAWTDSIIGLPRQSVPSRLRFQSRNLRQIFQALYNSRNPTGTPSSDFPTPFPIVTRSLIEGQARSDRMLRGTMDYYHLTTSAGSSEVLLRFSSPSGVPQSSDLRAQVGIFRLP